MKYATSIDSYIHSKPEWKEALLLLRQILNDSNLEETLKWGMPVYTLNNKNIAGFSAFKSFVGIWFYQGVFLTDPEKKLINAQEGVTKAMRQWRFISAEEIEKNRTTILSYLEEAIQNQKDGKEVKPDRNKQLKIPPLLATELSGNPLLRDRFETLSMSKQREFAEYIHNAKREDTKLARLEKIVPLILEQAGLNDKYKN